MAISYNYIKDSMLKSFFQIEKKPIRGLLAVEWVVMGYLAITLLLMLFTYTKLHNPESMLWGGLEWCLSRYPCGWYIE